MIIKYYIFFSSSLYFCIDSSSLRICSPCVLLDIQPSFDCLPPCALHVWCETTNAPTYLSNFHIIPTLYRLWLISMEVAVLRHYFMWLRPDKRDHEENDFRQCNSQDNGKWTKVKTDAGANGMGAGKRRGKKLITRYELVEIEFCVRIELKAWRWRVTVGIYVGATNDDTHTYQSSM